MRQAITLQPETAMKSSISHPLRMDALDVPGTPGVLGLTFCPGKRQRHALTGAWERDLDADLQAIAAWGASVLVNLVEDHEMRALGVADTSERLPPGITYYRLPIPDAGIPDARWERDWVETGAALRAALMRGERIVVHCKGGLGRTGLVAARLLIELGTQPAEAVRRVRAARPGSIETAVQYEYVLRQRALPDAAVACADASSESLDSRSVAGARAREIAGIKALFHERWDKSLLRREYPPQLLHPHKQLLYDIACASEAPDTGDLVSLELQ